MQAVSQVEFSSMTQETDESLKQWVDRVIETAHRALRARVHWQVRQEQAVLRFAMGCQDIRLGRRLIECLLRLLMRQFIAYRHTS